MRETFDRRGLIPPELMQQLNMKSDLKGALQVASHLAAIGATGAALHLTWGSVLAIVPFVAHGILINFLYAGQHELSHLTVFRTRWPNLFFGRLFGFIGLFPRDFDRIQHNSHHAFTQDPQRDGDLDRPPYSFASYLWWLLGPDYWMSKIMRLLRFSSGIVKEAYVPEGRKADVIREARWHMMGYGAIATLSVAAGSWAAIIYWLAPMLATKCVHQLQNAIEHLGLPHVGNIYRNTRSTRTNGLMRWMCWNMQYHTAHHAFPGVPFHKLPALNQLLFARRGIEPPRMTYLGFQRELLKALRRPGGEAAYRGDEAWVGPAGPGPHIG